MKPTSFFDQQQVNRGYALRLDAESVNSHALIPAKYIGGQVILLLQFGDLRDGRGGIDLFEVQTIVGRLL